MPKTIYEYDRILTPVSDQLTLKSKGYTPFYSSNVSAGMRSGTDLYIRFHNGSIYRYPNQGENFNDLLLSPSKGKWVWTNLRRAKAMYMKVGSMPLDGDRDLTDEELFAEISKLKIKVMPLKLLSQSIIGATVIKTVIGIDSLTELATIPLLSVVER